MRGNCIPVDRFNAGIGVKLNGTTKYTDANNIIEFTPAEIAGAHNHDGYHMKLNTGNTGSFTFNSIYNRNAIVGSVQQIYRMEAGSDYCGTGWDQPVSDMMRLILFIGDNGDDPIICQQIGQNGVVSQISLMDRSHNTGVNYLTCTGMTANGGVTINSNINLGGRYYQNGTLGMIVGTSANGNMYWAV